ncbi:L-rhamnose mutarotase [Verminephrobacter aporrectodeae]|uniref:L-rhamnose mutarotase n=1 Tax=Verminephrobacter aporrectodeae subsp. tuberculatae TaxID=1110392 RepID=A0ABT3KVL4_9BURK|nr:L-rhamnose mutarotase [Verminephrobacter aporrectodeae]MCW5222147.1 L-rhamnose mutarotase [Verminephrobacter aporrectodeae subsp. tuberculatae]MCW5258474.1 L-rhamnose mutarotase [Verminephrobacter aporrectodeae subsp. tuberculatae]MCW5291438.1 L-rhamnose mutarotase [Verminephrobacter aporrectodeae subsp. tuberculatae]MCW5322392.1 L-rhamnose mutarotase [Verminephrobacter aporrectodeae subsp. tuberculatae]MCW8165088.1 L-rhamnose mutarotase [Verminephrobacter aporrectodeae subsp. tuberculatae]
MSHEKIAFRMFLDPGHPDCVAEYKRRHDAIWPELTALLGAAGVSDYSIYLDEENRVLFATLRRSSQHGMDALPAHPVMQRWWAHMADIMRYAADGTPVVELLPCVFHMD